MVNRASSPASPVEAAQTRYVFSFPFISPAASGLHRLRRVVVAPQGPPALQGPPTVSTVVQMAEGAQPTAVACLPVGGEDQRHLWRCSRRGAASVALLWAARRLPMVQACMRGRAAAQSALSRLPPNAAAPDAPAGPSPAGYPSPSITPASPLWLRPPVASPRTEKHVHFSWGDAGSSRNSGPLEGGRAACDSVPPASAELQAAIAGWNARLPLAGEPSAAWVQLGAAAVLGAACLT